MNFFYLFFILYILGISCPFAIGSPCKDSFTKKSVRPTKTRLDSSELLLPEKAREEETLKSQGYNSFWTRGLDEVNEWLALKEQFIKLGVDPQVTHIDYFVDKIPMHIEYIKKGIISQSQKNERLKALELLEKEVEKAVQEKKVTYKWWIHFNYSLSKVLSPSYNEILDPKTLMNEESSVIINSLINLFPEKILIPTTKGGLGIIAFNRVHPLNIHPVGLVKIEKNTHNRMISPQGFFLHDIGHANRNSNSTHSHIAYEKFHKFLIEKIQDLPLEKRKNIELMYFVLTHELNSRFITDPASINKLEPIIDIYYRDFEDFINLPSAYRQAVTQIKQAANDFTEIFFQIKEQIVASN